MPKDYKDRVPGTLRRLPRRRKSRWLWVLPAVLAGVVAIALFSFAGRDEPAAESVPGPAGGGAADENAKKTGSADAGAAAAAPPEKKPPPRGTQKETQKKKKSGPAEKVPEVDLPEPRFTFYKILPEKEVIVSESEIRNIARDEKAGKTGSSSGYLIQAGSFATQEEAEKMKTHLAAAKVRAKMEKVIIDNATWYRVKIGPYKSLIEAEQMRAYLRRNQVDSVLQQAKP